MRNIGVLIVLCCLTLLVALPAQARPLIGDLSEYDIRIDSTFSGKNLILFGAQNDPGDLLTVVRGPERRVTIHRKEKVLGGIWVNGQSVTFLNVPYYYSLNGSRKLADLKATPLLESLGIGQKYLQFHSKETLSEATRKEFLDAFWKNQQKSKLHSEYATPLKFLGDTLFKTLISFPDNLPRGNYAVDMYLLEDGHLRGMQTLPLSVHKVGFDAAIYEMAQQDSTLYALMAIGIALFTGWAVSQLFTRLI